MGRGKNVSNSKSAYNEEKNENVKNTMFNAKRNKPPAESKNHSLHFVSKYLVGEDRCIHLTRNPESLDDQEARKRFFTLVHEYETGNSVQLKTVSRIELLFRVLKYIENNNAIFNIKDDSRQFQPYEFRHPAILKLYFYKLFYTQIFDFDVSEDDTYITFRSNYINENFYHIFQQIETLINAITYDALIIAIETVCQKHILSMKSKGVHETTVDCSSNISELECFLTDEFNAVDDSRVNILKKFIPSIIFFAKHYASIYRSRELKEKKVSKLINYDMFYSGSRADESRDSLVKTYNQCRPILDCCSKPFERLLNLYHINKRTSLFDFSILSENREFMPYLLAGIVTKYHIHNMIMDNGISLKTKYNTEAKKSSEQSLMSVYNNPNCILMNLTSRDYEIIDFIITKTAKSVYLYYMKDKDRDASPLTICDKIDLLDTNKNPSEISYSDKMSSIVSLSDILVIDKVDYDEIYYFRKPLSK